VIVVDARVQEGYHDWRHQYRPRVLQIQLISDYTSSIQVQFQFFMSDVAVPETANLKDVNPTTATRGWRGLRLKPLLETSVQPFWRFKQRCQKYYSAAARHIRYYRGHFQGGNKRVLQIGTQPQDTVFLQTIHSSMISLDIPWRCRSQKVFKKMLQYGRRRTAQVVKPRGNILLLPP
jgi:hypothetical protein